MLKLRSVNSLKLAVRCKFYYTLAKNCKERIQQNPQYKLIHHVKGFRKSHLKQARYLLARLVINSIMYEVRQSITYPYWWRQYGWWNRLGYYKERNPLYTAYWKDSATRKNNLTKRIVDAIIKLEKSLVKKLTL